MLHVMRNDPDPGSMTVTRALELLGSRLPDGWAVVRSLHEPRGAEYGLDGVAGRRSVGVQPHGVVLSG